MLKIITNSSQLDFAQLAEVYDESLINRAKADFPGYSENQGYILAKQDLYHYMHSDFFADDNAICAVWAPQGRYKAVLRLERYRDGLLLEGLETSMMARGRGCASSLVAAVVAHLWETEEKILYSHVHKKNEASMKLHVKCGFEQELDYAVFIDGSVSYDFCTMQLRLK